MKKFSFPLSVVANWSRQKLAVEELVLFRLVKELADIDEQLRGLQEQVQAAQNKAQAQAVITGRELEELGRYVRRLGEQRTRSKRERLEIVRKVGDQRQRVLAEHRKVKLFENLYEVRKHEWMQELAKEEDSLASDLFLAKLSRDRVLEESALRT